MLSFPRRRESRIFKTSYLERFKELDDKDIEFVIKGIIESNPGLAFNAIMGDAMKKLKGKADPKKIVDTIKKLTS